MKYIRTKDGRILKIVKDEDFEEGEETNQWLIDVINGLKNAEKDLDRLDEITKILTDMIEDEKNGWLDEYNLGQYLDKIVEWLENDK